jgi:hypothetical protein
VAIYFSACFTAGSLGLRRSDGDGLIGFNNHVHTREAYGQFAWSRFWARRTPVLPTNNIGLSFRKKGFIKRSWKLDTRLVHNSIFLWSLQINWWVHRRNESTDCIVGYARPVVTDACHQKETDTESWKSSSSFFLIWCTTLFMFKIRLKMENSLDFDYCSPSYRLKIEVICKEPWLKHFLTCTPLSALFLLYFLVRMTCTFWLVYSTSFFWPIIFLTSSIPAF